MRILTWNINGIRAMKTPLKQLFDFLNADIICLQETKITRDLLDEPIANVEGYKSFFSFSKKRSGYSGVAIYCKDAVVPVLAEEGISGVLTASQEGIGCYGDTSDFSDEDLHALDSEGRSIMTQHKICVDGHMKDLVVICVYCPRAASENEERQAYKLKFYRLLQTRAEALVKAGRHVVIVGDVNSCHRPIDHCDPQDEEYFMCQPGRMWLNRFLVDLHETETEEPIGEDVGNDENGSITEQSEKLFVDTFRFMHPTRTHAFTCWCSMTSARQTNYGTRIDYIFADVELLKTEFSTCDIMPEVEGSDHCPVKAELKCKVVPSEKLPPLCSKFMPEFSGKQQKLSSFFTKLSPSKKPMALPAPAKGSSASKQSGTLKRTAKPYSTNSKSKKLKTDVNKGNLFQFFNKTNSKSSENEMTTPQKVIKDEENCVKEIETRTLDESQKDSQTEEKNEEISEPSSQGSNASCEESTSDATNSKGKTKLTSSWKALFSGPRPPPKCKGHNEDCVMRTVKKAGPNYGKQFYCCARGEGHKSNPDARCNFFLWKKN
ncbi:DNA-(apurinic or apyrimidinic site) lyase 2-like [Anneissia japonica]|uniref:DNA-(apurinic or apyrimidinic site) lyase 2-like n=1 Tax=Anneissia japonica TaxID=1529436 RepID=UPI001425AB10|nr:DNA-(apurinic or apyrimidinic site) lyase 2-like [Anneissia japonica]